MIRLLVLLMVVPLVGLGFRLPDASAAGECPDPSRVLAVDAANGHLMELETCGSVPRLGEPTEVDIGDWRGYLHLLAVRDGAATVLYAVTANGELWWRRQESAGTAFSAPVRIGASIDWSQYRSLIVSGAGYLSGLNGGVMHTFVHSGWASGGAELSEEAQPLFLDFAGPSITAVRGAGSFAEGNELGAHFRIWRTPRRHPEDRWYMSGGLPAGLTGVAGAEPTLFALNAAGHLVLLRQQRPHPRPPRKYWECQRYIPTPWDVAAESADGYSRIIVPVDRASGAPAVAPVPLSGDDDCDPEIEPYEWQGEGV
jgi:hypothetical protein